MVVTIRPASVNDADAVGEVHMRAWQSAYRGVIPDDYLNGLQAQDHATRWREHLIAPSSDGHLLVVVDDHRVVGFASLGPALDSDASSGIGQLYAINLDPKDQFSSHIVRSVVRVFRCLCRGCRRRTELLYVFVLFEQVRHRRLRLL
ncbi:MAG: hypothetical protein ABW122_16120 [Ilumatobacteraceae bacterium]